MQVSSQVNVKNIFLIIRLGEEKEQTETERRKPRIPDSRYYHVNMNVMFDIFFQLQTETHKRNIRYLLKK